MNGSAMWINEYTTFLPSNVYGDEIRSFAQDSDGNIYVTGRHYGDNYGTPTYTNCDILTLKLSPEGEIIWENRYQYGITNCDIGNDIVLKNGYLYIAGESQRLGISTDFDYTTLKINATTGTTEHVYRYNGLANGHDALWSVCVLDNGDYAVTGLSYINSKYNWTTQFITENALLVQNNQQSKIEISPNPIASGNILSVNGGQYFKYKLLSITGQIVQSGDFNSANNQQIMIDAVTSGMYLLQLENDKEITLKKLIVK
jgi:Secretion system C-terminal sorting domain